jgi:hypothetical protein
MSDISEYHLFMKMLEIIEIKQKQQAPPSEAERQKIVTIIKNIEGNLTLVQDPQEEVSVKIQGDNFENVSNSIIATRGSIATGVIQVRKNEGEEVASALEKLEQAIAGVDPKSMAETDKKKALELLDELTKQIAAPSKSKVVLAAIGGSVWELIKNVEPIIKTATTAWSVLQKIWS